MFFTYFKYFFKFIVLSKNRQRLLILAIAGLFLSSFALIILQSTMGGLQNKLMERSKKILGHATISIQSGYDEKVLATVIERLNEKNIKYSAEYEIELMAKYRSYLTPVIVHAIDTKGFLPDFLASHAFLNGVIPFEIAYKMEFVAPDEIKLISPSHVDSLFLDLPRQQTVAIDKIISTDVPEVDGAHIWVRLPYIQNLIHEKAINRIRIYQAINLKDFAFLPADFRLKTWEAENSSLVWALNLESTVMVFLFAAMSLLVSLCITSGLLIFFNKIKNDLSSFWILGASLKKIQKSTALFLHLMSMSSIAIGLLSGLAFLFVFDKVGANIMPDVFVDRKIPVLITFKGIILSVFIPYFISWFFIHLSLEQFKREYNLLDHVRSIS